MAGNTNVFHIVLLSLPIFLLHKFYTRNVSLLLLLFFIWIFNLTGIQCLAAHGLAIMLSFISSVQVSWINPTQL